MSSNLDLADSVTATKELPRVSHYGTIHIGDLAFDVVVLEGGERGYTRGQFFQAIGYPGNKPLPRFLRFLAETAPNALNIIENTSSPVVKTN